MSIESSNEITVKVKCSVEEFIKVLQEKGFRVSDNEYEFDDLYFIPAGINIEKMTIRQILSKAILIRNITDANEVKSQCTYKIKKIDEAGKIIEQRSINCEVLGIEDAKEFIKAIGYIEIMHINEKDYTYAKDGLEIVIKRLENGEVLFESETNKKFSTTDEIIEEITKLNLPIYTDNYFVKKAECALERTISNMTKEKSCGGIIVEDNKIMLLQELKGHWGFPKGHVEAGETEIETALREIKEETNLDVEINPNKRYTMTYITDSGKCKQVVLFKAKIIGGELSPQESEIRTIKWINANEVFDMDLYGNVKEMLFRFICDNN